MDTAGLFKYFWCVTLGFVSFTDAENNQKNEKNQ